jgi:hypothetical protein
MESRRLPVNFALACYRHFIRDQILRSRLFLTCIISASAVAACTFWGGSSWDEVARATAPGGLIDAVLIERNGGATTSFGYEVFVVPSGSAVQRDTPGAVASLYGAVRNDNAYGVNLRWQAPGVLAIEYRDAHRAGLNDSVVTVAGQRVRVALRPGVSDPTAPSGGMLWNRQGRSH